MRPLNMPKACLQKGNVVQCVNVGVPSGEVNDWIEQILITSRPNEVSNQWKTSKSNCEKEQNILLG